VCMFYFARCLNIIFNSLLTQHIKYDVHTTHKIKLIHAIFITYYYYKTSEVVVVKNPTPQLSNLHLSAVKIFHTFLTKLTNGSFFHRKHFVPFHTRKCQDEYQTDADVLQLRLVVECNAFPADFFVI